jgi:tetratricopeptide (TPR) repeat protein
VRRHVASEANRNPPAPDLPVLLEARAQSIALTPGADARLATSLFCRAAEVEAAAGKRERAEKLYRRALEREPEHLPALVRLRKLLIARGAFPEAVDVLELEAGALRRPTRRSQALLSAAVLAADQLRDPGRARGLLERAVEADARNDHAFTRLRKLLEQAGELGAVTELLARRLAGASPEDVTALRLERVDLLLGPLGDRVAAKAELRRLLENEPDNSGILGRLAALELEDGDHGAAAELSIRQARFERDPEALEECFLRIGRLYMRRLNDPRVALGAYERVLRISPGHREALEALSELYARQNDSRKALAVTERLVEQEVDPEKRLPFLIRLGTLWEAAGDVRRAGVILRRAVDESPRNLQSIGELARFHERHKELQARKVLLEGSLSLLTSRLCAR